MASKTKKQKITQISMSAATPANRGRCFGVTSNIMGNRVHPPPLGHRNHGAPMKQHLPVSLIIAAALLAAIPARQHGGTAQTFGYPERCWEHLERVCFTLRCGKMMVFSSDRSNKSGSNPELSRRSASRYPRAGGR